MVASSVYTTWLIIAYFSQVHQVLDEIHHVGRFPGVTLPGEQNVLGLLVVQHVLIRAIGHRVYVRRVIRSRLELIFRVILQSSTVELNLTPIPPGLVRSVNDSYIRPVNVLLFVWI